MKKVLITGGAGYLGSHLTRKLLDVGYHVTILDNFSYGDYSILTIRNHSNLKIITGDICNIKDVVKATRENDHIIALAAIVGDPACALNEEETLSTNYESTKVLVEIAKYYNVKRILFASSCSVYGASSEITLNEGSWLNPVSLYAKTRIMSEDILMKNCGNVIPIILRMGTLFGQSYRMRYDLVINTLSAKATRERKIQLFGGEQWRPFIHVQDAAKAFLLALEADVNIVEKQIFNIGSNELNLKIRSLADIFRNSFPDVIVEFKKDAMDNRSYFVNFDKSEKLLGFTPNFSIVQGVAEMVDFLSNDTSFNYLDDIYYNVKYLYKHLI